MYEKRINLTLMLATISTSPGVTEALERVDVILAQQLALMNVTYPVVI